MSASALDLLRAHDPARELAPLDGASRDAHRARILERSQRLERRRPWRTLRVAAALAAALAVGVGAAWASGLLSPLAIFENNAQREGNPPGGLWDQTVDPSTVRRAASVQIPHVGAVDFWYGESAQGGWCGGVRLPDGEWLGTGQDKLDAGGALPGCYPTRAAVNGAAETPVYVLNGFDYQEGDVDARSLGGSFWRIWYGRVDARGSVRVVDRFSGAGAPVQRGLFAIAVADPNPTVGGGVHLVALASDGKVLADDCPNCNP
jgi:(2Fe-2S) ferredoxin